MVMHPPTLRAMGQESAWKLWALVAASRLSWGSRRW
jgi:hypothetical protein